MARPVDTKESEYSLFQQLLSAATIPSPVKAMFGRDELEVIILKYLLNSIKLYFFQTSAVSVCQFLASEVYQPVVSIMEQVGKASPKISKKKAAKLAVGTAAKKATRQTKPKKPVVQAAPSPVVQSLMEMGFSRKIIDHAIKTTGSSTNIERLVGWLLEHPDVEVAESGSEAEEDEEEDSPPAGNDLAGDATSAVSPKSDTDSSTSSSDEEEGDVVRLETDRVYKTRDQFSTVDEYAAYVKDHLHVGMTIKCCESYEEVKAGDTGKVTKVRFHEATRFLHV